MLPDKTEISSIEQEENDNTLALLLLIAAVFTLATLVALASCTLMLKGSIVIYDILDFSVTSTVLAMIYQQLFA